jgi:hypothetical protein
MFTTASAVTQFALVGRVPFDYAGAVRAASGCRVCTDVTCATAVVWRGDRGEHTRHSGASFVRACVLEQASQVIGWLVRRYNSKSLIVFALAVSVMLGLVLLVVVGVEVRVRVCAHNTRANTQDFVATHSSDQFAFKSIC